MSAEGESTKKPIRAGIIGLGVGERHLVGYESTVDVEVAAVCDINPVHLETVADRHDVSERYTDWHRITEHPDIDVVSICSYDDTHAQQCVSAFNHGKHVLVEKPLALYRHEAEEVLRAQQDSGKLLTSNLILRQSPRFREVRRQVKAGEFGEVFCIEGDYIHDILWKITEGWRGKMDFYCVVFGGGIHLIDLMRWILGQEVTQVSGMSNKVLTRGTAYRFDDTFMNLLRFEDGAVGKCLSTFGPQHPKFHALKIFGTRKTFVNGLPHGLIFDGDQPENETVVTTSYPGMEKGDLIPDFIAAIREGREPDVTARDVFRVMDICLLAQESALSGRTLDVHYMT